MPDHVNFITGNANKLREVKLILEPAIEVRSQAIDVEETQGTIEEVTKSKCRKAAELVSIKRSMAEKPRVPRLTCPKANGAVLVEDTALCYNALGGLPGPYM